MAESNDASHSAQEAGTHAREDVDESRKRKAADEESPYQIPISIEEKKVALGWIGRLFGDREEKTGNIAVTAIVLAFVLIRVVIGFDSTEITRTFGDDGTVTETTVQRIPYAQVVVTGAISIITAALGYVFGVKKTND